MRSSGERGAAVRRRLLTHLVLILLCLPALMPLIWMVSTSLKADSQIYVPEGQSASPLAPANILPHPIHWQNYPAAMEAIPLVVYLRNTLRFCLFTVIGTVLSSSIVAYGFARLQFRGKNALFLLMISTMALPRQVTMIPVFVLFRWLGWYGTYLPLIVPTYFGDPFFIFLLTQFYRTLPEDLSEAARVDGAGEWTIFWRVMLPLTKPALVTCALFQFMGSWNEFFGPLIYINDASRYPLAYGLQQFLSIHGGEWTKLMAASTLFALPVILLFFFAQRTFIEGIATTGGKN